MRVCKSNKISGSSYSYYKRKTAIVDKKDLTLQVPN